MLRGLSFQCFVACPKALSWGLIGPIKDGKGQLGILNTITILYDIIKIRCIKILYPPFLVLTHVAKRAPLL